MAESVHLRALPIGSSTTWNLPRHTVVVRITHWINTLTFFALLTSGTAILLAHPRLYWGETGAFGSPALIELLLPLNLDQSGWGRSLHFLAAWVCVLNGAVYFFSGLASRHFMTNMVPPREDLAGGAVLSKLSDALHWRKAREEESAAYNGVQRLTYLGVVFLLFPLMIVTGLAMSPAVTSVVPAIVELFGGYQSSRTVHFFVTDLLVLFLIVHVAMVCLAGFRLRMRAMIMGHSARAKERI
jgi:thiosulfate reductase cytochrome b subunit